MNENDLSFLIRGAAFKVHSALGPGLLESVYEVALSHELKTIGLEVRNQVGIPFIYAETRFDIGFRLDVIVNDKMINRVGSGSRRCPPTPPGILNRTTAVSISFYTFILRYNDCKPSWANQYRFMAWPTAVFFDICHQP